MEFIGRQNDVKRERRSDIIRDFELKRRRRKGAPFRRKIERAIGRDDYSPIGRSQPIHDDIGVGVVGQNAQAQLIVDVDARHFAALGEVVHRPLCIVDDLNEGDFWGAIGAQNAHANASSIFARRGSIGDAIDRKLVVTPLALTVAKLRRPSQNARTLGVIDALFARFQLF